MGGLFPRPRESPLPPWVHSLGTSGVCGVESWGLRAPGAPRQYGAGWDNKEKHGQRRELRGASAVGARGQFPRKPAPRGRGSDGVAHRSGPLPPQRPRRSLPAAAAGNPRGRAPKAKLLRQPPPPSGGGFLESPRFPRLPCSPFFCVPQPGTASCRGGGEGGRGPAWRWVESETGQPAPQASCSNRSSLQPQRVAPGAG